MEKRKLIKNIIIIFCLIGLVVFFIYLFINSRQLNCSLELNEDGVLTTKTLEFKFKFLKQSSRKEKTDLVFEDEINYESYYTYLETLYKDEKIKQDIIKDDNILNIKVKRDIINKNHSQKDLSTLEINSKLNRTKLKKQLKDLGYTCK